MLAAEVRSALDVPPADNSSMDGYALRAADAAAAGAVLPVAQRIPAGVVGAAAGRRHARRASSPARRFPPGADAVVMQEQCEAVPGDGLGAVRVRAVPAAGRLDPPPRRGRARRATWCWRAGTRLTPQALGLAASVGAATLQVVRRPRVALFSTGDELVMPGEPLQPGAIYNSNRFMLRALLQACGCEVTDLGIVPDRLQATRDALRQAAQGHDLILSSGGVSVGEEDHLKPAVQAEGRLELWQIAIKPGKPLAFGEVRRRRAAGRCSSACRATRCRASSPSCCAVAPVLQGAAGRRRRRCRPALPLRADFDWPKADKRREFLRVRLNATAASICSRNQSSGVLTSAVWADGLVDNPPGQVIRRGDTVRFLPLSELIAR